MKRLLIALVLPLFLACGGGGSSTATPTAPIAPKAAGFTLKTSVSPATRAQAMAYSLNPMVAVDPSTLEFDFGIAGNQGGALAAANSTDSVVATAATAPWEEFLVSTVVNGVTVGANGVSETFQAGDLSISPNLTGATSTLAPTNVDGQPSGTPGIFMTKFSSTGGTTLNIATGNTTKLTQVDEVVLRLGNQTYPLVDSTGNIGTVVMAPHFTNATNLYSDVVNTLTVGSGSAITTFANTQYILFVPASKIGTGNSFLVSGDNTVIDPIANGTDLISDPVANPTGWNMTDPKTWVAKDTTTWISDPGCAGLTTAINYFVATGATTLTAPELAAYFQAYFIKFYAAESTMFNNPTLHILGNMNTSASFEIIALEDAMPLTGTSTLNLVYDASASAFDLSNGILNLTGQPPIKFTTSITN